MGEVMRFRDIATIAEIATVAGVPIWMVIAFCDSHSLRGVTAESFVSQAVAERIVRGLEDGE